MHHREGVKSQKLSRSFQLWAFDVLNNTVLDENIPKLIEELIRSKGWLPDEPVPEIVEDPGLRIGERCLLSDFGQSALQSRSCGGAPASATCLQLLVGSQSQIRISGTFNVIQRWDAAPKP